MKILRENLGEVAKFNSEMAPAVKLVSNYAQPMVNVGKSLIMFEQGITEICQLCVKYQYRMWG